MRTYGDPYLGPPPPPHRVRLAGRLAWAAPSDSHADVFYTVVRTPDGHWECDCPGCRYAARADGECKHIDRVRGWLEQDPHAAEAAADLAPAV